ncbi:MAG: DUF4129 domain-containing protein [Acidobacteria bacterium]|nr:DUF4129 domain-containing protein [Acidobacteriota bacterium]
MKSESTRTTEVLDEGWKLARGTASPWWGILWLGMLPWRAVEIHFWNRTLGLGDSASSYGTYLGSIAAAMLLTLLPASWARLVYVRACIARSEGKEISLSHALRVPPHVFISHLAVKLLILAGLFVTSLSGVGLVAFVALGGLSAVTAWSVSGPGIGEGLRKLAGVELTPLVGITFAFCIAFVAVMINLGAAVAILFWLADAVPGLDLVGVRALMMGRLFQISILWTSLLIMEPFWLGTMTALVQTGRRRKTGADLAARLERAFNRKGTLAAALVCLLAPSISAAEISLDGYRETLEAISADIRNERHGSALDRMNQLRSDRVRFGELTFVPDESLFATAGSEEVDLPALLARIDATVAALRSAERDVEAVRGGYEILDAERRSQELPALPGGGAAADLTIDRGVWDDVTGWLTKAFAWISEKLEWLWDWLITLWPQTDARDPEGGVTLTVMMTTILIAACLLALVLMVIRRSRRRPEAAPVIVERIASVADHDPRSREESEWVGLARSLAAAGRHREAIRAWYNAILSTLIRTRRVAWIRGRTNWEYVEAVAASSRWKGDLVRLTAEFDREWYGNHEVDSTAYASFAETAAMILDSIDDQREGAA